MSDPTDPLGTPASDTRARAFDVVDQDPEASAAANRLAQQTGRTPAGASLDREVLVKHQRAIDISSQLTDAPATSRWFKRNAEISHDDIENMSEMERWVRSIGQSAKNTGRTYELSNMEIKRLLGTDSPVDRLNERALRAEMEREPDFGVGNWELPGLKTAEPGEWFFLKTAQDLLQFVERAPGTAIEQGGSIVESYALSASALVTGGLGPTAAYTVASLREGASVNASLVDEYKIPEDIARAVSMSLAPALGGIEYAANITVAGKALPAKVAARRELKRLLGNAITRPGALGAFERVAKGAVVEGGEEALTSIGGDMGVIFAQVLAGKEPEVRVTIDGEEYTGLTAVLLSAYEAFKVGATTGAVLGAGAEAAGKVMDLTAKEGKRERAAQERPAMDALMGIADGSKVRVRDPGAYQEALREQIVEHGAPETVYVPAAKIRELYQEASAPQRDEMEAAVPGLAAKVAEAEATGADVAIPTEAFVGRLIHTEAGANLRKAWRTDPDGMTPEEADSEVDRLVAEGREGAQLAQAPDPYNAYQRRVEEQLREAGRPASEAREVAVLHATKLRVEADRRGIEFDEALRRYGDPEILSEWEAAREGKALAQARAEKAGEFDRDVAAAMLAEARTTEPSEPAATPEEQLRRDTRAAFRAEVERLGFDVQVDPEEAILDALEAEAAEDFVAAQDETSLFQRSAIEGTGPARWLRGAELKGNKRLAADIAKVFESAPSVGEITAAALAGVAKRGWYKRSLAAIAHVFGPEAPRFTALLSSLSPQDTVQHNLLNALRAWSAWTAAGRPSDEATIEKVLRKKLGGDLLDARKFNAITSLAAPLASFADGSFKLSGQKVDSFYRNLTGDMEAVTLDAWMATFFGLPNKKALGNISTYRGLSAVVRKAAEQLSKKTGEAWTPAEVQETVWSWAKALVEQRSTPLEFRTAHEIVRSQGLDPERIRSVPDFAALLSSEMYARVLKETDLADRVRELAERGAGAPGDGAEAEAGPAREAPRAPLERAARRIERVLEARERSERELAQRPSSEESVERLRGLGLRVEVREDKLAFVGHDGRAFTSDQIETPEGMKAFHEALGFPTDPAGRDTIEDLKVYRLKHVFGETMEEAEAKLRPWLDRIGWTFKKFGPGMGPNGKPLWPNFREEGTPSYTERTAWIFNPEVAEGSFFDPAYTLAWRVPHEVAHGLTNPMMDRRYGPGFRAGALGKVVRGPFFKEDVARTLNEALRATDWEIETFKAQRRILEDEFGVDLTEEEFRKENGINYSGALYRAITGQFADPNTVGVLPAALDPDALQTLGRELLRAVAAERGAITELASRPAGIPAGARGVTRFSDDGKVKVILTRAANASTAIHEMFHVWWDRLEKQATEQLAQGATAKEVTAQGQALSDWRAALRFVGAAPGERLTDRQLEKLARAGEAYLREGRAPSLGLREAFSRFAGWLRQVYRTFLELERDAGQPVRLSDDIRAVMDRMLATDAEIAEAKRARGFTPPAEAAIVSLMNDDEKDLYERNLAAADRATRERVAQKVHKIAKERRRASWDEAVAELQDVVAARVDARPEIRARHWLQTGEWLGTGPAPEIASAPLDRAALVEMYGKGAQRKLDVGLVGPDGIHPDIAAEALGYTDGDALVRALEAIRGETREKITARELKARVKSELGSVDEVGREEIVLALAELHEHVDAMKIAERALARRAGKKAVALDVVRKAARRIVAETAVIHLSPGKYRAAAEREGLLAVKHAGSAEYGEALAAKRRQMLNVFLEAEARKAKERADANHDRLAWLQGPQASVTLTKAGRANPKGDTYIEQILGLLERFNLKQASGAAIQRRQSFAEWIAEREAEGETPPVPDHLRDEAFKKNWREMTVAELQDVTNAANAVYALARRKVQMLHAEKLRDRDEVRTELIERAARASKAPPSATIVDPDDPKSRSLGKKILSLGPALDKVLTIVDHLDGGDTTGPWHTYVYRPIADALGRKQDMARQFVEEFHGLLSGLVRGKEKSYAAKHVTGLPFPDEFGRPGNGRFSKLRLLGLALNRGNDSNWTKTLDGYGWTEEAVDAVLSKHLTSEDWAFVQKTWDLIDKLWPEIAKQEETLNGVTPERVIAREFNVLTADGKGMTLRGGYFPVVYDPTRSTWAFKNASRGLFEGVENHFMRAITGHGHTHARTEVTGPILFDVGIVARHLDEVIHDLAFRSTLLDVDALLDNKDVKTALGKALGKDYEGIFRPWLQSIAQDRVSLPRLMRPWERMLRRIRVNTTSAVLFFRDTTLLAQLSGHTPALAEMRAHLPEGWAEDYKDALRTAAHHPKRSAEFVRSRSAFMRSRVDNTDRDRRDQVRELQGQATGNKLLQKAIALGGAAIANTQFYGVDVPVWIAAYNAAQRLKGLGEKDAGFLADQIVKLSQGSGESIDLSEMQRGTETQKMLTTFYSYLAAQWAALQRDVRGLRHEKITFGEFAVRFALRFTLPAVYMTAVRALMPGGGDAPDWDDEDYWDEAWWAIGASGVWDVVGAVPILRDVASVLRYGRVSPTIPALRVAKEAAEAIREVGRAVTDEVRPVELFADITEVIGMVTGLPVVRLADLVKELNEEDE